MPTEETPRAASRCSWCGKKPLFGMYAEHDGHGLCSPACLLDAQSEPIRDALIKDIANTTTASGNGGA